MTEYLPTMSADLLFDDRDYEDANVWRDKIYESSNGEYKSKEDISDDIITTVMNQAKEDSWNQFTEHLYNVCGNREIVWIEYNESYYYGSYDNDYGIFKNGADSILESIFSEEFDYRFIYMGEGDFYVRKHCNFYDVTTLKLRFLTSEGSELYHQRMEQKASDEINHMAQRDFFAMLVNTQEYSESINMLQ